MARTRGVSPVVGVVLLVALSVVLAGSLAAAALSLSPPTPETPVAIEASADASGRVTLQHHGGRPLSVSALQIRLTVDGDPLRHQPPVPFVGAPGFRGAPTGPFNAASDDTWSVGERAAVVVAGTNRPTLDAGDRLLVTLTEAGRRIAVVETTVQASAAADSVASRSVSSGTRATVVIARGVPGFRCWMWCSNSRNPAASNIRSASRSS